MKKPAEEAEEEVGETGRAVEGLCGRLFGVESRVAVRMETLEEGAWLHQLEGTVEGLLEYRLSFLQPCSSPLLLHPLPHAALSLTASLGPLPLPAPLSLLLDGVRASCSPRLFFAALRSWVLCHRLRRLSLAALRARFPSRVSAIREDGLCAHTCLLLGGSLGLSWQSPFDPSSGSFLHDLSVSHPQSSSALPLSADQLQRAQALLRSLLSLHPPSHALPIFIDLLSQTKKAQQTGAFFL